MAGWGRIRRGSSRRRRNEQGYVLLTLMLFIGLMVIAAMATLPDMIFQLKRDREEEMVHRGVQYSRAVRRYYRKFGGYPVSLDQLDGVNHLRFLRKHYKDPVTGQDFKVLHQIDVQMLFRAGGVQGAQTLGAPVGAMNSPTGGAAPGNASGPDATAGAAGSTTTTSAGATDPNASGSSSSSQSSSPFVTASGQPAGDTMGGGPIVGVASTSTKESIRVYNKKDHYNDWFFAYDPAGDRGALITGPWEPTLTLAGVPGQTGLPGQPGSGFGQPSGGFGQVTPGTIAPMQPAGGARPH